MRFALMNRAPKRNAPSKYGIFEADYYTICCWMEVWPVYGQQDSMYYTTFIDKIWGHHESDRNAR